MILAATGFSRHGIQSGAEGGVDAEGGGVSILQDEEGGKESPPHLEGKVPSYFPADSTFFNGLMIPILTLTLCSISRNASWFSLR